MPTSTQRTRLRLVASSMSNLVSSILGYLYKPAYLEVSYNARMGLVCGCQLMTGPLDAEAMRRAVEDLRFGWVVSCFSEVPGNRMGEPVDTLIFTADEETALFQMFAIAEEAAQRWDANVSLAQRLGELMPGDASLVVVAACSEQAAAFDCCRYVADMVAKRVPVWAK